MAASWAKRLYDLLPAAAQNLAVSLSGWQKRRFRLDRVFREKLSMLEQTQWMTPEESNAFLDQSLSRVLQSAGRDVPAYKEIAAMRLEGNWRTRLASLPVLRKERVREAPEDYRSRSYARRRVVHLFTSGTTGTPLEVWIDPDAYRMEYAFIWHHRSWAGVRVGDRIATITGHPVLPAWRNKPPFCRFNWAENQLIFSSYHMSRENLRYYVDDLARFRPVAIHGYPSSLYLLAAYLAENHGPTIRPRAIFTAAEMLFDRQRQLIEEQFHCRVFMWYGNSELTVNIVECPEGSYHIRPEYGIAEFLDTNGVAVEAGTPGHLVGTGLNNLAMPFIRYDTGDVAVPREGRCPCGRCGQLVMQIEGRSEDYVVTADGRLVGRLDHILKGVTGVREAQLVQEREGELLVRIAPGCGYDEIQEKKILAALHQRLGHTMKTHVVHVEEIPRAANGKFRFVVSDLARKYTP